MRNKSVLCGFRGSAFVPVILLLSIALSGHDLARSESRLEVQGNEIRSTLIVDLLAFEGVDGDGNGRISYEELDRSIASVFARVKEHFIVRTNADPSKIVMTRHELVDEHTIRMEFTYTFPLAVDRIEVTSTLDQLARRPDHQHFVTAVMSGDRKDAVLDGSNRTTVFEHRSWNRTAVGLTLAAIVIIGVRVGIFVYQKRRLTLSARP